MRAAICAALAAALLAGCAAKAVFGGGREWSAGWREGKVKRVGSASELGYPHSYDCRYRDSRAGREAVGLFAVVVIENMGRQRNHVVPVEAGNEPRVGDRVLTNGVDASSPSRREARDLDVVGRSIFPSGNMHSEGVESWGRRSGASTGDRMQSKNHWEKVYTAKTSSDLSWFQNTQGGPSS